MTPDQWNQLEALFHAASAKPAEERASFLDVACEGNQALRRGVDSLLTYAESRDDWSSGAPDPDSGSPATAMQVRAGTLLSHYRVEARVGAGGMGEVFRAVDTRLNRPVAIKVSAARFGGRFRQEARAIAALNHPNICTLHDVGPDYLVMELVEGTSPEGPLPLDEVLRIADQIAMALSAAHAKGIVHRDLKPSNIKITSSGLVKVLDFGLAKKVVHDDPLDAPTMASGLTEMGAAVGTPAYMAPEQSQGKPVDRRADVWAFGVLLYELITGQRPFTGDSAQAVVAAVLVKEPDWRPVPVRVRRLLRACLQKDPQQRLCDTGDWRLLLDDETASSPPRHVAIVPWAVAAVAIVLGLIGYLRTGTTNAPVEEIRFGVPIPGGVAYSAMFALSPDARSLVISAAENGKFQLRVRRLDDQDTRLLAGTVGARYPFWSPDGTEIGFFADGNLKTVPASGGEPAVVTASGGTILGGTWSNRGLIVFSHNRALYKIAEGGGQPELLYKSGILFQPEFLPDGRHFLYTDRAGVWMGSVDAEKPVRLLPDSSRAVYSPAGFLLFIRQGRLGAQRFDAVGLSLSGNVVPITRENVRNSLTPTLSAAGDNLAYQSQAPEQLAWLDRKGAVIQKIGAQQEWGNFRLSYDQTRVVFDVTKLDLQRELGVLDLRRETQERITIDGKGGLVPIFSPDGNEIAFTSQRTGRFNPYIVNASGQTRMVTDMGLEGGYPVDWSPDGKSLLYWGDEDLWVIPVNGETKPYAIGQTTSEERAGVFSPDSQWIAYESDVSGRHEIYLQPLSKEGRRYTVSNQGGSSPAWRRDGKELFYVAGDGNLTAVPVMIRGTEIEFGRPESLFPVNSSRFHRAYEPSIDGQRFLVAVPAAPAEITVRINWAQSIRP
jgi:eukaryotic-like serine/threonine-protein kinase